MAEFLPLFPDPEPEKPVQAARLAPAVRALAAKGIFFGTSSWKYEGWLGSIYTPERYATRGKFSRAKFESECLAEYAETFPVVGGDFSFYQFPTAEYWRRLFGESPPTLRFGFKVPEEITVASWPQHVRYGARAGKPNTSFLDAGRCAMGFLRPLEPYRDRAAVIMFEFGTLAKGVITAEAFRERLADFLNELPAGFRYAVEIRNPEYLGHEYFATLSARNVAHVFNAWTRMPTLETQAATAGAFTADFTVVRALLRKGRAYEAAVKAFEPYRETREPDVSSRNGMAQIAAETWRSKKSAFMFVNNRLEGNAPSTIEAVIAELDRLGIGAG